MPAKPRIENKFKIKTLTAMYTRIIPISKEDIELGQLIR